MMDFPTEEQAREAAQMWEAEAASNKRKVQIHVEYMPKHAVAGDESEVE